MKRFLAVALAFALGLGSAAALSFQRINPDPMTVARLQERAEQYVANYPQDPQGSITVGNIHALAFRYRAFYLNSLWSTQFRKDKPPYVGDEKPIYTGLKAESYIRALAKLKVKAMPEDKAAFSKAWEEELRKLEADGWKAPVMTPEQELAHFKTAVANYEKMIAMKPTMIPGPAGTGTLALAKIWEEFSGKERYATYADLNDLPARKSDEEVAAIYRQAFELTKKAGLTHTYRGYRELHSKIPAYEAATCYLRLLPTGKDAEEMKAYLMMIDRPVK